MWLYVEEPLKVSHHPAKFGGHGNSASIFSLSRDHERIGVKKVLWLYGWEPTLVSHHELSLIAIDIVIVEI